MKKILLSISFVLISAVAFAQNPISLGKSQLNLGLGFSDAGIPVYIGLDHCIVTDLTIGLEASYRGYNEQWNNQYYKHNIIGLSGNFNYHFNRLLHISSFWDLYAGLNIGYYAWASPDGYTGNHNSGLGLGGQVGVRYYFSDRLGLNLEFGGVNAFKNGKLGISFQL